MADESSKPSVPVSSVRVRSAIGFRWAIGFLVLTWLSGANAGIVKAQDYLESTGSPPFSAPMPVEGGFIDSSNGSLHLRIPLGSFPQRSGWKLGAMFSYDSNLWEPWSGAWEPDNAPVGPALTQGPGSANATYYETGYCNLDGSTEYAYLTDWSWTRLCQDGTIHYFNIETYEAISECGGSNDLSGAAFAMDGSGYYMSVVNFGTGLVYAPDGTFLSDGVDYATVRSQRTQTGMSFLRIVPARTPWGGVTPMGQ